MQPQEHASVLTVVMEMIVPSPFGVGVWVSCRLEIWLKFGDDLVNLSFKICRNGEFRKSGDGDFAI